MAVAVQLINQLNCNTARYSELEQILHFLHFLHFPCIARLFPLPLLRPSTAHGIIGASSINDDLLMMAY